MQASFRKAGLSGGKNKTGFRKWEDWWVGWLAHDPLQGRCPRAAPNPLLAKIEARCRAPQWPNSPKKKGTGVVVLRPSRRKGPSTCKL